MNRMNLLRGSKMRWIRILDTFLMIGKFRYTIDPDCVDDSNMEICFIYCKPNHDT